MRTTGVGSAGCWIWPRSTSNVDGAVPNDTTVDAVDLTELDRPRQTLIALDSLSARRVRRSGKTEMSDREAVWTFAGGSNDNVVSSLLTCTHVNEPQMSKRRSLWTRCTDEIPLIPEQVILTSSYASSRSLTSLRTRIVNLAVWKSESVDM